MKEGDNQTGQGGLVGRRKKDVPLDPQDIPRGGRCPFPHVDGLELPVANPEGGQGIFRGVGHGQGPVHVLPWKIAGLFHPGKAMKQIRAGTGVKPEGDEVNEPPVQQSRWPQCHHAGKPMDGKGGPLVLGPDKWGKEVVERGGGRLPLSVRVFHGRPVGLPVAGGMGRMGCNPATSRPVWPAWLVILSSMPWSTRQSRVDREPRPMATCNAVLPMESCPLMSMPKSSNSPALTSPPAPAVSRSTARV